MSAPTIYVPGYLIKEECISSYQQEQGGYFIPCPCNISCKCEYYPMTPDEKKCLDERKYWCFLLSSVATFSTCVALMIVWRILSICTEDFFERRRLKSLIEDEWAEEKEKAKEDEHQSIPQRKSIAQSANTSTEKLHQFLHLGAAKRKRSSVTSITSSVVEKARKESLKHARERRMTMATPVDAEKLLEEQLHGASWMTEAKIYAGELISAQTLSGQVLVLLSFIVTMASLIMYFYDASKYVIRIHAGHYPWCIGTVIRCCMVYEYNLYSPGFQIESCIKWTENPVQQLDFGLNMFFLAYFFIRLIAAQDKLWFLFDVHNFVDYFTIPPSIAALYLGRNWLGLRFLRALGLMTVPDILQYLSILKTSGSIRLAQLLSIFISVSLAAAGFIHLLENSGDPWRNFDNPRRITYWDCIYFLVVTMGTVGYGDVVCTTSLARLFMIFFILGGLAMFASYIPEIVDIVGSRPKYRNRFEPERGKRHVVVCGYVTFDSVNHLAQNFMLDEKKKSAFDIQLVFLHRKLPDLELEGLLKRNFTKMEFIHGSVMEPMDLARVQAENADACLVLANKYTTDPDAEDAANIMRVVGVKTYCSDIRVIVQLIQYHSKTYLLNIPTWNWRQGDDVVCLNELKLGILAQSCLSPGISTMLANLFTMRPVKEGSFQQAWQPDYLRGSSMNIFMGILSHAFVGMSFPDATDFIFSRLRVLLIAIEVKDEKARECNIVINPSSDVLITTHTQGFFIARTLEEVKRVFYFCKVCHANTRNIKMIKKCKCKDIALFRQGARPASIMIKPVRRSRGVSVVAETSLIFRRQMHPARHIVPDTIVPFIQTSQSADAEEEMQFDSTGMFHWCPARPIEDAILERRRSSRLALRNHVVVCLFADVNSPLLGLGNFIMPLRASNLHYHELKHVVLVGNLGYLRREWRVLRNLPKISVLVGHPICRADLRAVNLDACDVCVILSARMPNPQEDSSLADKEAILASLNIKAMRFDNLRGVQLKEYVSAADQLAEVAVYTRKASVGTEIRLLTELSNDANVQFLDQEDEDDPETGFHLTLPFACGHAFAVSVLDSLMSMTYFNDSTLTLIRALVTGGATLDLEMILAEGGGLRGAPLTPAVVKKRNRCRIAQLPLNDVKFDSIESGATYGHLFRRALRYSGVLCIGLYRLIDDQQDVQFGKRLVITNPPPETNLMDNDMVFVLQHFDFGLQYQSPASRQKALEVDDD